MDRSGVRFIFPRLLGNKSAIKEGAALAFQEFHDFLRRFRRCGGEMNRL